MPREFQQVWYQGEIVTILGTERRRAVVCPEQPTNTDGILVEVEFAEEVYPYEGTLRLYPEWMLEKTGDMAELNG